MRSRTLWPIVVASVVVFFSACTGERGSQGPAGPEGPAGPAGPGGPGGDAGTSACSAILAGQSPGLNASVQLSTPANGQYFAAGERVVATIAFTDNCGRQLKASELGTASLYLVGPRGATASRTPNKMLNSVLDRSAPDRQHHYIKLAAPNFADPSQNNFSQAANGTITYTFGAISDEPPGTYSLGVHAKSLDDRDQQFPSFDFQVKTAQVEELSSGPEESATCLDCHKGTQNGKVYLAHMRPGRSPFGSFALDSGPIATCKMCHNLESYSRNPIVRKVHGVHRGEHQMNPGVAHPEYGLVQDDTLKEYTNVGFASIPGAEKDCQKCHADNRWKQKPSRLACGTCHDNVFFDSGTLNPPRVFGKVGTAACTDDGTIDTCKGAYGDLSECNTATGLCERIAHPVQLDDTQCGTCHTPDKPASGTDHSIAGKHDIPSRTQSRGLQLVDVTLTGGSLSDGSFTIGDRPALRFKITDRTGTPITNVLGDPDLSGSFMVMGPTSSPKRLLGAAGAITMAKNTDFTFDAATGYYAYTSPQALPSNNQQPFNNPDPSLVGPNPSGTYAVYFYIVEANLPGGARDSVGAVKEFRFVRTVTEPRTFPIKPRQVIAEESCNRCHVDLQLHGGSRSDPEGCYACHNLGARDRTVGARGRSCTADSQCPGFSADGGTSWETCSIPSTGGAGTCVITVDPTPEQTIDFGPMVHDIHFARLRDGWAERNNLVPGGLPIVGYQNTVNDFSEVLFPMDIRNCTNCHADSLNSCTSNAACGYGQECVSGKCRNSVWKNEASGRACLTCHDSAAAFGHAALNTTVIGGQQVETCAVCHGAGRDFSSEKAHNISSPYVPPYPREKE